MRICVNGQWHEVNAGALAGALHELGYGEAIVATAVNGRFVAADARDGIALGEGDKIEIVAPMQGG